jgi:ABC-type sugar transport system permease subunit
MAGAPISGGSGGRAFAGLKLPLLAPALVTIGVFLLIPVGLMAVYSVLTKDFRGGVIWEFSLAAYDQFFLDRGLFGDDPPTINWAYMEIFCARSGRRGWPPCSASSSAFPPPSSSRRGPTAPRRSGCFW